MINLKTEWGEVKDLIPFFILNTYLNMANINKIRISGTSYDIQDSNAPKVVELTQAQYDALVDKDPNVFYIITDASQVDLSQYWTSAQTNTAISQATSGKTNQSDFTGHTADTSIHVTTAQTAAWDAKSNFSGDYNDLANKLSAGTNVSIVDNVINAEGGGKAVSGGTNISVTTGATADTINCTIPAFFHSNTIKGDIDIGSNEGVSSDYGRLVIGRRIQSRGNPYFQYSIGIGVSPDNSNNYCQLYGQNSVGIGRGFKIGSDSLYTNGINNAIAIGHNATSRNDGDIALGANATASGNSSVAIGSGATADGAEYKMNLNNQIKVTPSNQVYIYNKDNTEMICLQDQLGGGGSSYTAGDGIDITNDVISVTGMVDTTTYSTYTAATDTALSNKQTTLTAGTGISIVDNVISATGGGGGGNVNVVELTQAQYDALTTIDPDAIYVITDAQGGDLSQYMTSAQTTSAITQATSDKVSTSAITTSITSSSTDAQIPSAKAVYDIVGDIETLLSQI